MGVGEIRWKANKYYQFFCIFENFYNKKLEIIKNYNKTLNIKLLGFPGGSVVKTPAASAGEASPIPGSGRPPGGGHGNPLQYSCLETPMGSGAWRAMGHSVSESDTTEVTQHARVHVLQGTTGQRNRKCGRGAPLQSHVG